MKRRTRHEMMQAGETADGLRRMLDEHDKHKGWPDPETWMEDRARLANELAILEGLMFPNATDFDHK